MNTERTITVKPCAGRIVPDPARGDDLPADGRSVPRNTYWLRALNAGDVEVVEPAAKKTAAKG